MSTIDPLTIDVLIQRHEEAVRWCEPRADPARAAACLRTLKFDDDPLLQREWRVRQIVMERKRLLLEGAPQAAGPVHPSHGRVLAYLPDIDLYHGLEKDGCDGYIDEWSTPPVDTWMALLPAVDGRYAARGAVLLAWVPPVFIGHVEGAIEVNAKGFLIWFEDARCSMSREWQGVCARGVGEVDRGGACAQ